MEFTNYIGADESGKGDTFGPLAIAAVYITPEIEEYLIQIGVKDSKLLSDNKVKELAILIKRHTVHEVRILLPEHYNAIFKLTKKITSILKELYENAIDSLVERTLCSEIVIDKFYNNKKFEFCFKEDIELLCTPRAESYTAVAAASILARNEIVEWFESNLYHKGSGPETLEGLKTLYDRGGIKELERYAKLHFSNVQSFLNSSSQPDLFS